MLEEFSYLGEKMAQQVVIEAPCSIAEEIVDAAHPTSCSSGNPGCGEESAGCLWKKPDRYMKSPAGHSRKRLIRAKIHYR